jgi:hypothetical protein
MEKQEPPYHLERNESNIDDYKNAEANIEEVVIARLTEEDLLALSQESLRFKSWTTVRLALIMFVQGCNQAGYGIDWAVISGINAFDQWVSLPSCPYSYISVLGVPLTVLRLPCNVY